ncbi:CD3337/EF1877 family mobilome membrane protein [Alkalicoccobacillus gibsonii]|uniref:CD3337/EF1877 family mobilome membrane protein n=1 Tax=Alkalicoccobacillus gibsonii TaxID=79881 RepID=UPI003F7BBB45
MKRKLLLLGVAILLPLFLVFATISVTYAEDEEKPPQGSENMSDVTIEEKGGVELDIKRFPLNRYFANNEDRSHTLRGAFVGFANLSFTIGTFVVETVDKSMEIMYSLEPIEKFADLLTGVTSTVYDTLQTYFGELFFIIAIGYMIYLCIVRGSVKEAIRRFILLLLVLVVGGYWMMNAGYLLKSMNAISVEAQGYLLEAGNGLITIAEGDGVYADTQNIDEEDRLNGTVSVMRNIYFDLAVKKPYLIANYGTTSENAVNNHDDDPSKLPGGSNYNRVDRLLSFELTSDGMDDRDDYVKGEISELNNDNLGSGNVFAQLGISLLVLVGAVGIGIPFFLLPFLNLILEVLALALTFALPFAFIMAYIPTFANSGFKAIGKLLSVFLIKALIGILVLFVYLLCFIVDTLLPPNGFAMYLVNLFSMIILFFFMIKKRDTLVNFITAGKVQSVDNNMVKNVQRDVVNPALQPLQSKMAGLRLASSKQTGQEASSPSSSVNTPNLTREQATATGKKGVEKEDRTAQTKDHQETPTSGSTAFMKTNNERTPQQVKQTRAERKKEQKEEKRKAKQGQDQKHALTPMSEKEKTDRRATKQNLQTQHTTRSKQQSKEDQKDLQSQEQQGRKANAVTNLEDHKALRTVQKGDSSHKQPSKETKQDRTNQNTIHQDALKPKERETKAPTQREIKSKEERTKHIEESLQPKERERESKPSVQTFSNPSQARTTNNHSATQPKLDQSRQPSQTVKKDTPSKTNTEHEKRNQSSSTIKREGTNERSQQALHAIEKDEDRHSRRG